MRCRYVPILLSAVLAHGTRAQLTLLDPSFGNNGVVQLGLSGFANEFAQDVAVQPDGRIVVVGQRNSAETEMAVLRFLENGTLDPGFSGNGVASVNIGVNAVANVVALQDDGAILVAGSAEFAGGDFNDLAFARFTAEGQLDTSFSGDGKWTLSAPGAGDAVLALALLPDGRIVAAGKFDGIELDMMCLRLMPDGELDGSFATDGIYSTDLHTGEIAQDMVLRSDGRIVLAGAWRLTLPDADLAMLGLDADGNPDPGFGLDGLFRPSEPFSTSSVVRAIELGDGRIVIAGKRFLPGGSAEEIFTGRITPEGEWDAGYGTNGRAFHALSSGFYGGVRDMVLLPDGKVMLTADVQSGGGDGAIIAMRVLADGQMDVAFGDSGRVVMPCPGGECNVRSLALDAQGRILAVGSYGTMSGPEIMVMRWMPEASTVAMPENLEAPITVFPIPASDVLWFRGEALSPLAERAELIDHAGRGIHVFDTGAVRSRRLSLPASLADGVYILRIENGDAVVNIPVIVQR